MPRQTKSFWTISLLLLLLSATAYALKPNKQMALSVPIKLGSVFPEQFSEWHIDNSIMPLEPNPELLEKVTKTYDQTLSRTYINATGYKIMLSVAYGGNQSSDSTQVHRPEFCYTGQGFIIKSAKDTELSIRSKNLSVRQLIAEQGSRIEPITYWVTIGNNATKPGLGRKLLQIRYGLSGQVPDGLLIRVSSIDNSASDAYEKQADFINALSLVMNNNDRERVFGSETKSEWD